MGSSDAPSTDEEMAFSEEATLKILLVRWSFVHAVGRYGGLARWSKKPEKRACLRAFGQAVFDEWNNLCAAEENWQCEFISEAYSWIEANSDDVAEQCELKFYKKLCKRLERRDERWTQTDMMGSVIRSWCGNE